MEYLIKWVEKPIKEAKNLPGEEIIDIDKPRKDGEIIVSNVPKELKKFKTIINRELDKIRKIIKEYEKNNENLECDSSEYPDFNRKIYKRLQKIADLNRIFWTALKEQINYREKEGYTIGIRKGWKVVEFEESNYPNFQEVLKGHIFQMFNVFDVLSSGPTSRN